MDSLSEPKFLHWRTALERAGCSIRSVREEWRADRRSGELLFGAFRVDAAGPDGTPLPPIVLVRGDAVVVVPLVRNCNTGEERFAMVRQLRIGNGSSNLEFPAGMLDRQVSDPCGVAARELAEETGLSVPPESMHPLHDTPLHTSVGLLDEAIYFYGCVVQLSDGEYGTLEGRAAGEPSEHEHIVTALVTQEQAEREGRSMQVLLALRLFREWRSQV
jgi:8-oxo-dGTP pyrophosphatase MutT (NUDIX family)